MRIDYVNQEIMDALVAGYPVPVYGTIYSDDAKPALHVVTTDGFVLYVLEPSEVYFNLGRCREDVNAFKPLQHDETLCCIDNKLEATLDLRAAGRRKATVADLLNGDAPAARLLARFKGAAWDTFVDVALLEAFDDAEYYQDKENGPIAVVEDGGLVGYVMPVQTGDLAGHYTDGPGRENHKSEEE